MDQITVRCKMCQHAMKFSAAKAGKRAKCPKCDTILLIKSDEEPKPQETAVTATPGAAPAPAVAPAPDEEDSTGGYDVLLDPELEERRRERLEEETSKKKKERKKLPGVGRKVKAIPEAESWAKVRLGLLFLQIGAWIWFATHLLQGSYVFLGRVEFPEYAKLIANNIPIGEAGNVNVRADGGFWDMNLINVYLTMIAGQDFRIFARICIIVASVLYFFQAISWGAGYGICLAVPRRYGTFLQLIISMVLAFFNFFFQFFFKFLPVIGVLGYILIPYVTPEIVLTEYNMERVLPIHIMWSGAPFWETFLNLFLTMVFYMQPTFGAIFLWSIGQFLKHEDLESAGKGLTQLSLGALFVLMSFHLLAICGGSPVLVYVLRVFYGLWYFFLIMFIVRYALVISHCRAVLYEKIYPKFELVE